MPLNVEDIEQLKKLIKQRADNYPDIEQLIASGKLTYKSGWYRISDLSTFDLVKHYVVGLRSSKDGTFHVQLSKPSKRLRTLASKI
jgi:hypothetical protein